MKLLHNNMKLYLFVFYLTICFTIVLPYHKKKTHKLM
jgi:hypothetical protein